MEAFLDWWAGRGLGAFRDGERLSVSSVSDIGDAQLSFAWDTAERFHADGIGEKLVDRDFPTGSYRERMRSGTNVMPTDI